MEPLREFGIRNLPKINEYLHEFKGTEVRKRLPELGINDVMISNILVDSDSQPRRPFCLAKIDANRPPP